MKARAYMCLDAGPYDPDEARKALYKAQALLRRWHGTDRFCVGLKRWPDGSSVWLFEYLTERET